jgi:ribosomal protein S8
MSKEGYIKDVETIKKILQVGKYYTVAYVKDKEQKTSIVRITRFNPARAVTMIIIDNKPVVWNIPYSMFLIKENTSGEVIVDESNVLSKSEYITDIAQIKKSLKVGGSYIFESRGKQYPCVIIKLNPVKAVVDMMESKSSVPYSLFKIKV